MRHIDADVYSEKMKDYFVEQLENHRQEVDAVDCNADLQRLLADMPEVGGWVPCFTEEYPPTDGYILLSFANFSTPCVGRYEEDEEGGAFYIGDDDEPCIKYDLIVNAWMPLPTPYREEAKP